MLLPVGTWGLLNLATCCYQWEHVAISGNEYTRAIIS